ncbi:hypothetical protein [Mycobacterium tuberculosis]|uniref:hypothetical protein n=1 Tax=Mycobacterium tuberculosis TaxID=1773 RepID=UPI00272AAB2E|nr:hypothetical protein [Mycobacterium tuberculosis]
MQAEDEIAAVCSAIGASYAGQLGVTTSSGPGHGLPQLGFGLGDSTLEALQPGEARRCEAHELGTPILGARIGFQPQCNHGGHLGAHGLPQLGFGLGDSTLEALQPGEARRCEAHELGTAT